MADDTFGEHYFEHDFIYATSIWRGRRPLPHSFQVTYLRKHKGNRKLLDIECNKGFFIAYALVAHLEMK